MTNRWFGSLGFLSTEELLLSGRWGVGLPGGGGVPTLALLSGTSKKQ